MDNLIFSLNATVPVFAMMLLGLLFKKIGWMDDVFASKMNKFVFQFPLPVLVFSDLATSKAARILSNVTVKQNSTNFIFHTSSKYIRDSGNGAAYDHWKCTALQCDGSLGIVRVSAGQSGTGQERVKENIQRHCHQSYYHRYCGGAFLVTA